MLKLINKIEKKEYLSLVIVPFSGIKTIFAV